MRVRGAASGHPCELFGSFFWICVNGKNPFWWLCKHAMHLFEYRSVRSWSNEIDTTLSGGQKN